MEVTLPCLQYRPQLVLPPAVAAPLVGLCTGDESVPGILRTFEIHFTGSHAPLIDYGNGRCGARPGQRRRGPWQPRISMQADTGSVYGVCSPQAAAAAAAARRARWCVLLRRPGVALSILCCKPHWL